MSLKFFLFCYLKKKKNNTFCFLKLICECFYYTVQFDTLQFSKRKLFVYIWNTASWNFHCLVLSWFCSYFRASIYKYVLMTQIYFLNLQKLGGLNTSLNGNSHNSITCICIINAYRFYSLLLDIIYLCFLFNRINNYYQIHFIHARSTDILWIRIGIKFPTLLTQLTLTLEIEA